MPNSWNLNFITLLAEKRRCQRVAGDLADLQTHEALQEDHTLESEDTSAQVPSCHLCVSYISYPDASWFSYIQSFFARIFI